MLHLRKRVLQLLRLAIHKEVKDPIVDFFVPKPFLFETIDLFL